MACRWWQTLKELVTRTQGDDDLAREIRSHLDEEADDQIECGVEPEEARYAARRAFGNVTRVHERTRDTWSWERAASALRTLPGGLVQDAKYAIRSLIKQPAFTAAAVLALALGIGATTTIFSVIENVLFNPYPMYRNVDRMVGVMIHDDASSRPDGRDFFQTAEFLDYAEQLTSFDAIIAGNGGDVIYTGPEGTEQFTGGRISGNNFPVLGVDAIFGRTIVPEDAEPGAPPVFVMSYKLWANRFGMDQSLIGRAFTLDGAPTTLVGVMPPRVSKLGADIWRPIRLDRANPALQRQFFKLQARLKPGVTIEQADAEFRAVAARVAKIYPGNYPDRFTGRVVGFVDSIVRGFKTTLYTMAAAVGLLLLIACANVANLLLSRAAGRRREIALRASLGASRGRLIRGLFVESLLLALAGMAVGGAVAALGIKSVRAAMPEGLIPREALIQLNTRALLFSLAIAGLTALLFGLAPAFQTVRRDLMNPLRGADKGTGGGFRGGRLRGALVVVEIALSLVLLTSAGVLMRSFVRLQNIDLGFDPANVLIVRVPVGTARIDKLDDQTQFIVQALARIRSLPGVVDATMSLGFPPFTGSGTEFDVVGIPHTDKWRGALELIGDGYFRTFRQPFLQGRDFTADDLNHARPVAIVNRMFVERFFKQADPMGRTLTITLWAAAGKTETKPFQIVGVVENARNAGVADPIVPQAYLPPSAFPIRGLGFAVRTAGPPLQALKTIKHEIWAVDPGVPIAESDALETYLSRFAYAAPRLGLAVFTAFAGIGLALVVLGVYSLIAYTVSCQTREIGIRIAVGARRRDVLWMTIGMAVRWLVGGGTIGLAASYATTRLVASELFEVSPTDPLTFAAVVSVLAAAGFAASYFPARRATKVDPIVVLRAE
jgi:putative ABC transport system permease protein